MTIDTAVILAAGRGSRLKEVTKNRSKALTPVAGVPMIGRVIAALKDAGIQRFVIVGAPKDEALKNLCTGMPETTFITQEVPLGSGDALKGCEALVPNHFLLSACDSLVPADDVRALITAHSSSNAATLGVVEVAPDISLSARSVVSMSGDVVTDFIEKPGPGERLSNFSSIPLYVLTKKVFNEIAVLQPSPRGEYELSSVFRSLIRKGDTVKGAIIRERCDLTDQSDLISLTKRFLALQEPAIQVHPSVHVPPSVSLIAPVVIDEGVQLRDGAVIGPSVYVENGAVIGEGSHVSNSVVLRGVTVTQSHDGVVLA
jgi:NDP-sugar pyrophosphorylase family protein